MQLALNSALELVAALRALDGYQRVIKSGENEQIIQASYKLDGSTRRKISKNIAVLKVEAAAFQEASSKLFQEISGGVDRLNPDILEEAFKITQFNRENDKLLKEVIEVELLTIAAAKLQLDDNPIPGSVLASLEPIITDD